MKPVIALVGRPNVGKSTLFNRLTRSRDALVADLPGLTRDRHYGEGRVGERPFLVIDTGGFEPVAKEGIMHEMALQTKQAVAEADVVVFIVDGRQGLTPHDKTITDFLRKRPQGHAGRQQERGHEVHLRHRRLLRAGHWATPTSISAAHGDGVPTWWTRRSTKAFAQRPEDPEELEKPTTASRSRWSAVRTSASRR
jgi:GTP-binding protein